MPKEHTWVVAGIYLRCTRLDLGRITRTGVGLLRRRARRTQGLSALNARIQLDDTVVKLGAFEDGPVDLKKREHNFS